MKVYFSEDYITARHAFDTTRKAGWVAQSLRDHPVRNVDVVAPSPLTRDDLVGVHHPRYVDAVKSGTPDDLASSQGFDWDAGLWGAVCASNGGAAAAPRSALDEGVAGSLSSGMHHARRDEGRGFCTFNGLLLAAQAAFEAGARRVMILDLDAHCGGGTYELALGESRIVHRDVSVCEYDTFRGTRDWQRHLLVKRAEDYLAAVEASLDPVPGDIDLVIYNAGMDPYEGSSIGGMAGITADMLDRRETMMFDWARRRGLPVAFVLAGGYTGPGLERDELVQLHRLTIEAAARVAR